MKYFLTVIVLLLLLVLPQFFFTSCENTPPAAENDPAPEGLLYLNHSDSARYVGMNTCKQCHQGIYNSFIRTGMGQSFDSAKVEKSAAEFRTSFIHDRFSNFSYHGFFKDHKMFIREYRIEDADTVHLRTEKVDYIIGSGQHTNSHLQSNNGYMNQMPMTFYTQKKKWDLPPGFEDGMNSRFSRKIGLECMTCHNAYPQFVMGSENKFTSVPGGIDCERCHGPGSVHAEARQTSSPVDTSKFIDYTIVNPSKLPVDLQFDICQRCHLQGNAILQPGRSFFDFKPGQKLSDYINVFLPRYSNSDDEFVMASHADRLKQSPCYIESLKKAGSGSSLRPYKSALTCVTCHNPHVSVKETGADVFNSTCRNCHKTEDHENNLQALRRADCGLQPLGKSDCVSCHMPRSGSIDIPHVTVHDHFIRKPVTREQKDKIREFVGLFAVNNRNPDVHTVARAYIEQYEKFKQEGYLLDSAQSYLGRIGDPLIKAADQIQLSFLKRDYEAVLDVIAGIGEKNCFEKVFISKSYDNRHAWAAYRVGESFLAMEQGRSALKWFERAVELAPYQLDFRNKLGSLYAGLNEVSRAEEQFAFILAEHPKFVSAYANLGYIRMLQGRPEEALQLYQTGRKLDPDNETLLLNLTGYYLYVKDLSSARKLLQETVRKYPANTQARNLLKQLSTS